MTDKEMVEKRNDLITRAEEVLNTAKAENRELTDAEAQELKGIRDEVRSLDEKMEIERDIRALTETKENEEPKEEEERSMEDQNKEIELNEERAFENFIRGRVIHERSGELTPASGSGQALIPTTIANRIIKKVYDICPILEKSSKYNVKGTLELPYYDDSTTDITVAYASEFSALSSSSGAFATVTLGGFLAGALTKVSRSLINNVQFNIVDFVVNHMAYAIKRFIEHELLVGTPASGADPAKVLGLSTVSNSVTAASASAITADEIVKLHDAVKDDYQSGACWIMSPATRTALRLLKDGNGRYLLQDDVASPFGTSLLGKPVYVSDNMPNIATGKAVIYYGDMSGLATKFSEQINIEVLREKYADEHAVGVIGWFEFDSKVENAQKIAKLVMA